MISRLSIRPCSTTLKTRMASQRISMVSQHLSSTSSSSSSASAPSPSKGQDGSSSATAPVLFEAEHSLRKVILNRPKALNSLNDEMVELILPQLSKFEQSDLANVVLIKSNSKHFCAGGDVVCKSLSLFLSPFRLRGVSLINRGCSGGTN
jgi:3-hydroxyisobutyryl-CoA hydrolase